MTMRSTACTIFVTDIGAHERIASANSASIAAITSGSTASSVRDTIMRTVR